MINPSDHGDTGPTCFQELFEQEYRRIRNGMMAYIFRYHLARYPKDLLRDWWRKEGCMPWATSQLAFEAYKAGMKSGRLYRGAPHRPQLKVIEGGRSQRWAS
jgi:hypothetical protein